MEQSESVPNLNAEVTIIPKSLKTLGVLSLIMGGLMILVTLWSIKKAFLPNEDDLLQQQQQLEMIQQMNPDGYEAYVQAMESQGTQNVITLFTQIISVIGVFLMLKLKKNGFYLYVFGELIPYVITVTMSGLGALTAMAGAMGETMQTVVWAVVALVIVIDIVFIILYARHLKYMS
jgi:hypothetical protein